MRRVQQPNEPIDNFITCLHSQVERCDYGAMKDEMVRDRLVIDQTLSERLQMDAELTLKKAVGLARSLERVKNQQQVLRSDNQRLVEAIRQEPSRKTVGHSEGRLNNNKPCGWCGNAVSHARSNCSVKKSRCLNCGKYGHFNKVCRMKRVHNLQEEQGDEETTFLGGVNNEPADMSKPVINVELNGVSIQFRVDTGADVTVISSKDYANLDGVEMLQTDKLLSGPQSDRLNVIGKLITSLKYGEKKSVQEVFVIDSLFHPLLGWPAIKALNALSAVNNVKEMFPSVFTGLGNLKEPYEIKLKQNANRFM